MGSTSLLAFSLLLLSALHSTSAVVHRLQARRVPLPPKQEKALATAVNPRFQLANANSNPDSNKHLRRREPLPQESLHAKEWATFTTTQHVAAAIPVEDIYGWLLVANISVGTPPQNFLVDVDLYIQQLYVPDVNATYTKGGTKVSDDKQVFNSSASQTYSDNANAVFAADYSYTKGVVGVDNVQLGPGLAISQASIQVASQLASWMSYYDIDGSLGLAASESHNGSSFIEELAPQLDSPVITIYINRPYTDDDGSVSAQDYGTDDDSDDSVIGTAGTISLGDLAPSICQPDSWVSLGTTQINYAGNPTFNITGLSAAAPSDGCAPSVQAAITVSLVPYFNVIYTSLQVQEVFVQAANATWDQDKKTYVVGDVASAQGVNLQLGSGGTVQVVPDDYIYAYNGVNYLSVYGYYDQHQYASDYISLGQQFINNHCISQNINTGEWSIANAVQATEIDESDA